MSSLASTTITVAGTPTVFLPLSTAWPSSTGCTSNIYLHSPIASINTFLAWDPLYGASMVTSAQSCLPSQVSIWWSQASSSIYTALGPQFECPEAYYAVQTAVVATSLHQTFCCPSQYSLLVPMANEAKAFPSQCVSTVASGQTFVHLTSQGETGQSTTTTVMTTSATVFAIPVNGFAIVSTSSAGSSGSTAASTMSSSSTTSMTSTTSTASASVSASTSAGVYAGIVVGVVGGIALVVGVVFLLWRRRRMQAAHRHKVHMDAASAEPPKEIYGGDVYELSGR